MYQQLRMGVVVLSISSASAFADEMIYMDHNANIGPKHEELLKCVDAARSDPAIGTGLMLSTRMGVSDVKDGAQTFILRGTAWENGKRVPVSARCVFGPHQSVASLTRIKEVPALAKASQ